MSSSSSSTSPILSPAESRSTTPHSEYSDAPAPLSPGTYVLVGAEHLNPTELECMFSKHARAGFLGLVIDSESVRSVESIWQKQESSTNPSFCYYTTKDFTPPLTSTAPYIPTSQEQAVQLRTVCCATLRAVWSLPLTASRTLHILEQPSFNFHPVSATPAFSPKHLNLEECRGNIPTLDEWRDLWKAWDLITMRMIPQDMLLQKPIDLRHKCLFYIGHIPTFLDILLSKSVGGKATEPAFFWKIFERGIDPHVDDPEYCHSHSEVPEGDEDWPTLPSVVAFRDGVRKRLANLYHELESGQRTLTRNIGRTLQMTLEHEGFHIETLLYMLIQRSGSGTLPPSGFHPPEWSGLAEQWSHIPPPTNPTVIVGPAELTMGHDDSEADDTNIYSPEDVSNHTFGWDNESPARVVTVAPFKAEWRPVTNNEFETFWRSTGCEMPKSWEEENGEVKVKTLFGPVPLSIAGQWPVLTSYDDLASFAKSKGGRLATEPELRLFLDTYDVGHEGGANVAFRNWHPVPATMGIDAYGGKGSNGGVWEWTSTVFDSHDGIIPTSIFPGYSSDFFDTKHQVVLGASYATIPRLAQRNTVRNFYQHNYPYPWATARVVYDVAA